MNGCLYSVGLSKTTLAMLALALLGLLSGCESFELPKWADMPWNKPVVQEAPAVREAPVVQEAPVEQDVSEVVDKAAVLRAQKMLADLGYEPGPADGVLGPKTRGAVRRYQEASDLVADGRISADLLRRLEESHRHAKTQEASKAPQEDQSAKPVPKMKAESPPAYEAGNTFVYSDGRVETVVGLKGDMVRWQRNDGTKFTADRNFLLPWANWQSQTQSGTQTWDDGAEDLWPRAPDQEVSFSVDSVVLETGSDVLTKSTEHWRCRLAGKRKVTVMAGNFDTLKLICDRAASPAALALQRVWYYAPSIQHYVRLENRSAAADQSNEVELVMIRPGGEGWPPIARAALSRAVEQALETVSNGRESPWHSSGVDTRVSIRPTSRFESGDGRLCRTFLQTWSGEDGERRYPGAACRDQSGHWRIPGLEDGSDESLAVSKGQS
jgi:peptidoglycan hydrolase-like protein with peptidoglycan-binding domain